MNCTSDLCVWYPPGCADCRLLPQLGLGLWLFIFTHRIVASDKSILLLRQVFGAVTPTDRVRTSVATASAIWFMMNDMLQ